MTLFIIVPPFRLGYPSPGYRVWLSGLTDLERANDLLGSAGLVLPAAGWSGELIKEAMTIADWRRILADAGPATAHNFSW